MTTTRTNNAVDRLLAAIADGTGAAALDAYTDDAVLDATVPGWRLSRHGRRAIAAQYAAWFRDPATFDELERIPTPGGEVVRYFHSWTENGVLHGAHHVHLLTFAPDGRIAFDRFFCGGRWDATTLAAMAEDGQDG